MDVPPSSLHQRTSQSPRLQPKLCCHRSRHTKGTRVPRLLDRVPPSSTSASVPCRPPVPVWPADRGGSKLLCHVIMLCIDAEDESEPFLGSTCHIRLLLEAAQLRACVGISDPPLPAMMRCRRSQSLLSPSIASDVEAFLYSCPAIPCLVTSSFSSDSRIL